LKTCCALGMVLRDKNIGMTKIDKNSAFMKKYFGMS
jgi:hypothetical protein